MSTKTKTRRQLLADAKLGKANGQSHKAVEDKLTEFVEGAEAKTITTEAFGGGGRRLSLTNASTIKPQNVTWVWEKRIPEKGLSILAGEEGLGKSQSALDRAARLTRGKLPGAYYEQPVDVIIVTAEDSRDEVVVPRLILAGADTARVHFLNLEEDEQPGDLRLPDDADELGRIAAETGAKLVIIDPLASFLAPDVNSHNDANVKRALNPLNEAADRHGVAMLGVIHLNKASSVQARERFMGSAAFRSTARATFVFGLDPDDRAGAEGDSRILAHDKHNLGKWTHSFRVRLEEATFETEDGEVIRNSRAVFGETCDYSAKDVLGALAKHETASKQNDAERFLLDALPGFKDEIEDTAEAAAIKPKTLRNAREALKVESASHGFGEDKRTEWRLPEHKGLGY